MPGHEHARARSVRARDACGVALAVEHRDVRGRAEPVGASCDRVAPSRSSRASIAFERLVDVRPGEEPVGEPILVQRVVEVCASRAPVCLLHHLCQQREPDRIVAGLGCAGALEQVERERDQDPARRRRRVRQHLAAAVGGAHRVALDHPVAREVLDREQPAALADPFADALAPPRPRTASPAPPRRAARARLRRPEAEELARREQRPRARRAPGLGKWVTIGSSTVNRYACSGVTRTPSRA